MIIHVIFEKKQYDYEKKQFDPEDVLDVKSACNFPIILLSDLVKGF